MAKNEPQSIRLNFFGHLAEDLGNGFITIVNPKHTPQISPRIINLTDVETPCVAYYPGNGADGVICYINDGDANSFARQQFVGNQVTR